MPDSDLQYMLKCSFTTRGRYPKVSASARVKEDPVPGSTAVGRLAFSRSAMFIYFQIINSSKATLGVLSRLQVCNTYTIK